MEKCQDCYLRYHCDEQTEFVCKHNDYCKYIGEEKQMQGKYEIVTLCGSTKFKDDFIKMQESLTLSGCIVISVGLFGHADDKFGTIITPEVKEMLDDIHKRKIDISDSIMVINRDDYIGESTRSEIEYALKTGKKVSYMFEHKDF